MDCGTVPAERGEVKLLGALFSSFSESLRGRALDGEDGRQATLAFIRIFVCSKILLFASSKFSEVITNCSLLSLSLNEIDSMSYAGSLGDLRRLLQK